METVHRFEQWIRQLYADPFWGSVAVTWSVILGVVILWYYIRAVRFYLIKPLRSTTVPTEARRKSHTKLSFGLTWCVFATGLSLAGVSAITTFVLTRPWIEQNVSPTAMSFDAASATAAAFVAVLITFGILTMVDWYWRRPVRLFCPHCGKFVSSDIPWICGRCNSENRPASISKGILWAWRAVRYSYLHTCKRCGEGPIAFRCHHCSQVFVLDSRWEEAESEEVERLAAYKLQGAPPGPESFERVRERHTIERERLEQRITIAELETRLAERKRDLERAQGKDKPVLTTRQKLQQTYEREQEESLAVHDIAREARSRAARKYANKPEMLEMENAVIEQFVNKHGLT